MKIYLLYIIAVVFSVLAGCATLPGHYLSLHNRNVLTFEEIFLEVGNEQVILVGEGHNRGEDHLVQFEIVRRLDEGGKRVAIALEMFPSDMQPILNQWIMGTISEKEFKQAYYEVWDVPYRYYARIFEYARKARIPLVGINVNKGQIDDVAKNGIERLPRDFRKEARLTPCVKAPEYERMINLFEPRIAHMTGMPFFCDAQLFRDTLMAYTIAGILVRDRFTVVALVGSAHALRPAVPRILLNYYDVRCKVIMSKAFAGLISREPDVQNADYLWY